MSSKEREKRKEKGGLISPPLRGKERFSKFEENESRRERGRWLFSFVVLGEGPRILPATQSTEGGVLSKGKKGRTAYRGPLVGDVDGETHKNFYLPKEESKKGGRKA